MKFEELYLDIDGTLADFETTAKGFINWTYLQQMTKQEQVRILKSAIANRPNFFEQEIAFKHAKDLYKLCTQLCTNIYILSSYTPPKNKLQNMEIVTQYKINWILNNIDTQFPQDKIIVTRHKKTYFSGTKKLLIDDNLSNTTNWIKKGGTAIHFDSYDNVKKQLLHLITEQKPKHSKKLNKLLMQRKKHNTRCH